MNCIKSLGLFLGFIFARQVDVNAQHFFDFKAKDFQNRNFGFDTLKGKKTVIFIISAELVESKRSELKSFFETYKDSLNIVGYFDSVTTSLQGDSLEILFSFCVSEANYDSTSLLTWLTRKEHNHHFEVMGFAKDRSFTVDESGRLFSVIPLSAALNTAIFKRVLSAGKIK